LGVNGCERCNQKSRRMIFVLYLGKEKGQNEASSMMVEHIILPSTNNQDKEFKSIHFTIASQ
jgi:hypothetical protein